jgi:dihydroxyacetone kinase-like protein
MKMKKFLNKPENFVDEMIEGIIAAHPDQLAYVENDLRCMVKAGEKKQGKVGLATGGGSGHLPLFLGYVGEGMLDGCSVGGVFQSPSAEQMLNVTKGIDAGAGVLYIYGNYGGDILNFDMAAEMAEVEDIKVMSLVGMDDVASLYTKSPVPKPTNWHPLRKSRGWPRRPLPTSGRWAWR